MKGIGGDGRKEAKGAYPLGWAQIRRQNFVIKRLLIVL